MSTQPENTNEPGAVEAPDGWLPPLETLSNDELLGELHDLLRELRVRLDNYIDMGEDDQAALDDGLLLATKTGKTISSHQYGYVAVPPTLDVAGRLLKEKASYKTLTSKKSCARGGERG